ncbi:MAG: SOS response-associated peptidase [Bacteroidota bacterium]
MCGRFSFALTDKIIEEHFDVDIEDYDFIPNYNCAPSQNLAVITNESHRRFSYFKWGMVPFWAKVSSVGNKMINAKAETIFEKPAFRNAIKSRRCLIPADSFYEWKKGKEKIPYRIMMKDESPFSMAGIWETWNDAEGKPLFTFSVITTEANSFIKDIHLRMPVILSATDEKKWLTTSCSDKIISMMKPYPSELMIAYPISKLVNSPVNNSAEIHKGV